VRVRQLSLEGMPEPRSLRRGSDREGPSPSPSTAVREFHQALDLPVRASPTADIPSSERDLRIRLIFEEAREFADAAVASDLIEIADALADLVYVTYGAALHYGIDLDAAVAEIHRANMSKIGRRGDVIMRPDGKVLKGRAYRSPKLAAVLDLPE
jgi:predicted HAD superfamily Cof-like phosphohydrolase